MLFAQKRVQGFLLNLLLVVGFAVGLAIHHADAVTAQPLAQTTNTKPAIVLVHGAFADGSSWQRVIPLLERDGYTVTAVQNPLTSLPDDIATTKRVIDAQKGSVVVVGHSYGGTVITGAAAGNPHVKALVYIAAHAPDSGETTTELNGKYVPPRLRPRWCLMQQAFSMLIDQSCTISLPRISQLPRQACWQPLKSRSAVSLLTNQ